MNSTQTYHFGLDGASLAQERHGRSLRIAARVGDDPYLCGDGPFRRFEQEVAVLLGDQHPVVRGLEQRGHGEVEGVLSIDVRVRLAHAQVIRGADAAFPDFGQQRRHFLQ